MDVPINGHNYRTGKLDAFKQFHIARRLAPALWALGKAAALLPGTGTADKKNLSDGDMLMALGPMADVIAKMSDADSEYVLNSCLDVCQREQPGGGWARIRTPGAGLQFEDIDISALMKLTVTVIRENLGNFFPEPPASP